MPRRAGGGWASEVLYYSCEGVYGAQHKALLLCCTAQMTSLKTETVFGWQAWTTEHMPKRGRRWLGRRPLVHKGFWRSWSSGVRDSVLDFVAGILNGSKLPAADWRVYITGEELSSLTTLFTINAACHQYLEPLHLCSEAVPYWLCVC
jgi:hypothetical protein